ncbi:MAG: RlmE family RNA methyltransferase [Nanoarchaeota archaeon]|nr:RlmE family RNA methyltransferase [Nanoarchaeota archaeon]
MKDKFTLRAEREGYKARSVYKLKEINNRFKLIEKGDRVLDLGAWPGSWTQYCLEKASEVVSVDKKKLNFGKPIVCDVFKDEIFDKVKGKFDVIVSDMAPMTSGIKELDEGGSFRLVMRALDIAEKLLKKGGNFLVKMFESEETEEVLGRVKKEFRSVKIYRPKATKKRSSEIYILGKNKK